MANERDDKKHDCHGDLKSYKDVAENISADDAMTLFFLDYKFLSQERKRQLYDRIFNYCTERTVRTFCEEQTPPKRRKLEEVREPKVADPDVGGSSGGSGGGRGGGDCGDAKLLDGKSAEDKAPRKMTNEDKERDQQK